MSNIEYIHQHQSDQQAISLEQYQKKRQRRRVRVARRMARRFPLFAVQFVKEEFREYSDQQFAQDIAKAKPQKRKNGKSQLARQGRYELMQKELAHYRITGKVNHLQKAQALRKKMFLPYELVFMLNGKRRTLRLASTTSAKLVMSLAKIKFNTWDELDKILEEKLKWVHVS